MKKEILKRIFEFLEGKGEHKVPVRWKLINNQPLTKEELIVDDDLDLSYTSITSLPEELKVGGSLLLSGCKNITSLPEGLKVGGDLFLSSLKITSLPEGLKVVGNLDLSRTKITSLPKGLKVEGNLTLYQTKITSLPEGLKVGDNIYIGNTKLKNRTDDELIKMIKPGFIKGKIVR